MHSATIFATAVLGFIASAAAAPTSTLVARDDVIPGVGEVACNYTYHTTLSYVGIYNPVNLMSSAQNTGAWGGGLIDNLRGIKPHEQCNPRDWQAIPATTNGDGLIAMFNVDPGCEGRDISAAIAATHGGAWTLCPDDRGADQEEQNQSDEQTENDIMNWLTSIAGVAIGAMGGGDE